jgi:ribosomal protein L1
MTRKDRPAQIIELLFALLAAIASAFLMTMIPASLGDLIGITVRAPNPIRPTQTANFLVTLRITDQVVDV